MSKIAQDKLNAEISRYRQTNKLVEMVRAGVKAMETRKRIDKSFATKLTEMFPAYTFAFSSDKSMFGLTHLRVWGNGVTYDESLYLSMSTSKVEDEGRECVKEELRRCDCSDYIARAQLELTVLDKLDDIAAKIEALSDEAKALCDFKVEGSLVNRVNYGASYTLQEVYPFLKKF
jgi:hypothetical protein